MEGLMDKKRRSVTTQLNVHGSRLFISEPADHKTDQSENNKSPLGSGDTQINLT